MLCECAVPLQLQVCLVFLQLGCSHILMARAQSIGDGKWWTRGDGSRKTDAGGTRASRKHGGTKEMGRGCGFDGQEKVMEELSVSCQVTVLPY